MTNTLPKILLLATLAFIAMACGTSDSGGTSPNGGAGNVVGTGGAQQGSGGSLGTGGTIVGAWYGTGPDGDQCIAVCPNGKVFTGDRPCRDVTAGDFDKYLTSSTLGTNLTVSGSSQCWVSGSPCGSPSTMVWNISGDAAVVSWCGFELQLNRTNDSLPVLCDDPSRGPC